VWSLRSKRIRNQVATKPPTIPALALIAAMVIVAHAGSTCQTYIEKASERGWRRLTTFVD
jgi:hypothetical protein